MKDEYFNQTKAYLNEEERMAVAWELLVYAQMLYHRVYVFKNFDAFARSLHGKYDNPPEEYWEGLSYEKLIDQIKICTAFENYNKAVLLLRGFVVHNINEKKNRDLARQMKQKPVLISDFLLTNSFVRNDSNELYLEGLKDFTTISFSRTLTPEYPEIIGLDNSFLSYLKNLNEKRNRLHFNKNYAGALKLIPILNSLNTP